MLPVTEMKTREFLIGLSVGLTAGILLMLVLAHRYILESNQSTPIMRMNTMTGQAWIIDQTQAGYCWKALGEP